MGLETKPLNDDAEFENDSVDPGFSTDESKIPAVNDDVSGENLKDGKDSLKRDGNDAMNLDYDRENGAYNPKNI